eukprot:1277793-Pyramimonas_sp.AAC.1
MAMNGRLGVHDSPPPGPRASPRGQKRRAKRFSTRTQGRDRTGQGCLANAQGPFGKRQLSGSG